MLIFNIIIMITFDLITIFKFRHHNHNRHIHHLSLHSRSSMSKFQPLPEVITDIFILIIMIITSVFYYSSFHLLSVKNTRTYISVSSSSEARGSLQIQAWLQGPRGRRDVGLEGQAEGVKKGTRLVWVGAGGGGRGRENVSASRAHLFYCIGLIRGNASCTCYIHMTHWVERGGDVFPALSTLERLGAQVFRDS